MLFYSNQIFLVFPSGAAAVVARFASETSARAEVADASLWWLQATQRRGNCLLAARPSDQASPRRSNRWLSSLRLAFRSALQEQSAEIPAFGGFQPRKGRHSLVSSSSTTSGSAFMRSSARGRAAHTKPPIHPRNPALRALNRCAPLRRPLQVQRSEIPAFGGFQPLKGRHSFARLQRENTRQAAIYAQKCPPLRFADLCKSRGRRYQPLAASSCAKARHIENLIVLPAGRQPAAVPQCCAITQLIASFFKSCDQVMPYSKHFRAGSACEKFLDSR